MKKANRIIGLGWHVQLVETIKHESNAVILPEIKAKKNLIIKSNASLNRECNDFGGNWKKSGTFSIE